MRLAKSPNHPELWRNSSSDHLEILLLWKPRNPWKWSDATMDWNVHSVIMCILFIFAVLSVKKTGATRCQDFCFKNEIKLSLNFNSWNFQLSPENARKTYKVLFKIAKFYPVVVLTPSIHWAIDANRKLSHIIWQINPCSHSLEGMRTISGLCVYQMKQFFWICVFSRMYSQNPEILHSVAV